MGEDVEEENRQQESSFSEELESLLQEVLGKVREGYFHKVVLSKGHLYLYDVTGDSVAFDLDGFSKKEQKQIKDIAQKEAKRIRDLFREGDSQEQKKSKSRSTGGTSSIGRRFTFEALDRAHAKIVRNVTEHLEWFADVVNELGFFAVIIAMQAANIPPEELYGRILQFRDPQEFSEYVKDHLIALLEAAEDAKKLIELRKKLDALDFKLAVLEEALEEIKKQRDQATLALYAAVSAMNEEQLRQFVLNLMVAQYGLSIKLPGGMPFGGVVNGSGALVSESGGEEEGNI